MIRTILVVVALGLPTLGAAGGLVAQQDLLLVVNKSESTLSLIEPETGREIAKLPTGFAPHEVAVSADGRTAYVTDYGTGPRPGNTVTVVDLADRRVTGTIDLGRHTRPHGVTVAPDGRVWVTTEGSAHVLRIDPRERRILSATETGQAVTHMVAVSPGSGTAFTANIGSGSVSVVSEQGELLGHVATGAGAEGIDVAGDRVYVTNRDAGTLTELDAESHAVLRQLEVGRTPIRVKVLPDGSRALVSNAGGNEVAVVDLQRWEVERRIPVGAVPVGILVTPDGRTAYVANTAADRISVLDLEEWTVARTIEAGDEPDGMAWVEGGR